MRSALSGLCGLLAALLLPLALVSVWLHTVVADPEEYLARVEPLARDERVREAVGDMLVAEVQPLLEQAAGDDAANAAAAQELVRRVVAAVVDGGSFAPLWSTAQRAAHHEVVSVLDSPEPLRRGDQVVVPLDAFVRAAREQLAELGLQLDDRLDGLSLALPLASARELETARVVYRVLEPLWLLLPVAAVVLALLSVGLARRRLRTLAVLGGLSSLLCLGLLVALGLARGLVVGTSPSPSAEVLTGRTFEAVSADLRGAAVTGVLVGLAVLVVAAVLGLVVRAVRRTAAG